MLLLAGPSPAAAPLKKPAPCKSSACQAKKDKQVRAFFRHRPALARTQAGQIALLAIEVRRLGRQVRALQYVPRDCRGGASREACRWYFQGDTQCEVDHEGGWTSVSPGGTYHGRFQTDADFERGSELGRTMQDKYGRASNWPPWAQIQHAYTVWLERGWNPWPPYFKYGCSAYLGRTYTR